MIIGSSYFSIQSGWPSLWVSVIGQHKYIDLAKPKSEALVSLFPSPSL